MNSCEKESLGRVIYKTSLVLRNYAEKLLSPYDLTIEQFHLLKNNSIDTGISQSLLCERVEKKPANITRILDRLEKKKWIQRRPNPDDRRSSLVFLTAKGQRVVDEVSNLLESSSKRFVEGIAPEEELLFRKVMMTIDANIKKLMKEIGN